MSGHPVAYVELLVVKVPRCPLLTGHVGPHRGSRPERENDCAKFLKFDLAVEVYNYVNLVRC